MSEDKRPFGVWMAAAMVVGSMIGSGIFVLPAQIAPFGWTGVAAWLVGGCAVMVMAYVLVDLTRAMPEQPSIVAVCGRVLGGPAGVLIGWSYWVSVWVGDAAVATTAARYFAVLFPALGSEPISAAMTGSAILAGLTVLNLTGARSAGRFQVLTTVLKLVPLLVVVGIIVATLPGRAATAQLTAIAPLSPGDLTPALGIVFFALIGFEGAAIVTERVRDPARNVMRGTLYGVAGTGALYILVCTGMALVAPVAELQASSAPIAWFVDQALGGTAGLAVAGFAAISAIGLLNSSVLFLGEIPLAAARSGEVAPWVARVNSRDVAVAPILVGNVLSVALMFLAASRSGGDVLDFMFRLTTSSGMALYAAAALAALVLGRKRVVAIAALGFIAWVMWAIGAEAAIWGVVLILAGVPMYFLARPSAPAQQPA